MTKNLTEQQRRQLLDLAREAIKARLLENKLLQVDLESLPPPLQAERACFVTLTKGGKLRGCVGCLEAVQPLALEVRDRALGAAFQDYRFPNLRESELDQVRIEISYLTPPRSLQYPTPTELPGLLRPGIDGVVLSDGGRRATFLPQVWQKLPDPEQFLDRLCLKMGRQPGLWRDRMLDVQVYQVEKFSEGDSTS